MYRKMLFLLVFVAGMQLSNAQSEKYFTRNAIIKFSSEAPLEKIISSNKVSNCILNTLTGELAFKVVVKSFEFDKQGMYDHFNDTYLESGKFPNATFQGKITSPVDYKKVGKYEVTVEGKLTLHGITKDIKQNGVLEISSGKINASSKFNIKLSDYGIIVPNDYLKKISNSVDIDINAPMTPYVR